MFFRSLGSVECEENMLPSILAYGKLGFFYLIDK